MPIIQHKWKPQWNCSFIEKFYYTEDGHYHPHGDATIAVRYPKEDIHEGRIMLERTKQGKFFVDWSTRNMFKIEHEVLGLCREKLKEYMDSLRTKSLVSDVETWTKVILWSWSNTAVRAAAALGTDGKIVRLALWDDSKKQYVPKQELVGRQMEYELYSVARWREVESGMRLTKEYEAAVHVLETEMRCFRLRDNNLVHTKVMRSLRDSIRKQTLALQKERAKRLEAAKKQ